MTSAFETRRHIIHLMMSPCLLLRGITLPGELLVRPWVEDCASQACTELGEPPPARLVTRWVVQEGHAAAVTYSLAAAGSLTMLILRREREAEAGPGNGGGGGGGSGGGSFGVPSRDDLVEVRPAAAGQAARWDALGINSSVLGVVCDVSSDGGRVGLQVLASALVPLEALSCNGGAAMRLGTTLTTSRREFEAGPFPQLAL